MHVWMMTCVVMMGGLMAPATNAADPVERWMVVTLDGQRLGHASESQTIDEQGNITTASRMSFSLERMGQAVSLALSTSFTESPDATPLKMSSTQELGASRVVERYEFIRGFAGDEVIHETDSQGRTTRHQRPWPEGDWRTPASARREIERRLAAEDPTFAITTIDPTTGLTPVVTTYTVVGPSDVEVLGKTVPAVRWTLTQSAMPGVTSTEFVDRSGRTLRSEIEIGGMTLTLLAADKELALSAFDPPEMMAQTLVVPSGAKIERARKTRSGSYLLALDGEDAGVLARVPDGGAQRVERLEGGRVRVGVEAGRTSPAGKDAADPHFRASSTMVDGDDPLVKELAMGVLARVRGGSAARASALREAVSEHIRSANLGVGLATASEVVRTRTGDCTEYAVLLAAALRAANIPSRVVSGVVYVDELATRERVFGYHMWTQAIVDGPAGELVWMDLDAAIPTDELGGIDATHIALATTSLSEDDAMGSMAAMVGVLGRLRIEVERVEAPE